MSSGRPRQDVVARRRLEAELEAKRIRVYRNLLGQPYVVFDVIEKTLVETQPAIHLYLLHDDVRGWLTQFIWEAEGNYRLIRRLKKLLKKIRRTARGDGVIDLNQLCFLLTGDSRSGKTVLIKFLVRCIACLELDEQTLNPCLGTCPACSQRPEQCGLSGLNSTLLANDRDGVETVSVHFAVIDCTLVQTPEQLRNHVIAMSDTYDGIRIFYFDEVHRLVRNGMDEMLLKAVEDKQAGWFFSTAEPDGLEDMFLNRLLNLATGQPATDEMAAWLFDRCTEWGIPFEDEAIVRVVDKSNRVVGTALHALAVASLDDEEGLTRDLVENDWQVKLDA